MKTFRIVATSVVLVLLAGGLPGLVSSGCGGGGSAPAGSTGTASSTGNGGSSVSGRGEVKIAVQWPKPEVASRAKTRSALSQAGSIAVMVTQESTSYSKTVVVNKDAENGVADFSDVPPGAVDISGVAYAGANATGTVTGKGTTTATVVIGEAIDVPLTFSAEKPTGAPTATTGNVIVYAVDGEDSTTPLPSTPTPSPTPTPTPAPRESLLEGWLDPVKTHYKKGDQVRVCFQLSSKADFHLLKDETVEVRCFWEPGGPTSGQLLDTVRVDGQTGSVYYTVPNDLRTGVAFLILFKGDLAYQASHAQVTLPIEP